MNMGNQFQNQLKSRINAKKATNATRYPEGECLESDITKTETQSETTKWTKLISKETGALTPDAIKGSNTAKNN